MCVRQKTLKFLFSRSTASLFGLFFCLPTASRSLAQRSPLAAARCWLTTALEATDSTGKVGKRGDHLFITTPLGYAERSAIFFFRLASDCYNQHHRPASPFPTPTRRHFGRRHIDAQASSRFTAGFGLLPQYSGAFVQVAARNSITRSTKPTEWVKIARWAGPVPHTHKPSKFCRSRT